MSDQKTEKTAEQVAQEKAHAFDYGIGRFLKTAGLTDPEFVQAFFERAHKVAASTMENPEGWPEHLPSAAALQDLVDSGSGSPILGGLLGRRFSEEEIAAAEEAVAQARAELEAQKQQQASGV